MIISDFILQSFDTFFPPQTETFFCSVKAVTQSSNINMYNNVQIIHLNLTEI